MPIGTQTKITLEMTPAQMALAIADGNAGAIVVTHRLLAEGSRIDPYAWNGGIAALLDLDSFGIHGEAVWRLHHDVCGDDLVRTSAVLRARQLGLVPLTLVHDAIWGRDRLDVDALLASVRSELPSFGAPRP